MSEVSFREQQVPIFDPIYYQNVDSYGAPQVGSEQERNIERSLVALDDDVFFQQRITQPNRTLRKYPEILPLASEAMLSSDTETLLEAADLIVEAWEQSLPPNLSAANTLLTYINLDSAFSNLCSEIGAPESNYDYLSWELRKSLINSISDDQLFEYHVAGRYLISRFKEMSQDSINNYAYNWMVTATEAVSVNISAMLGARRYAESHPIKDDREFSDEEIIRDSSEVTAAFNKIRETQAYGLKLGYKPHEMGGSIVMSPQNLKQHTENAVQSHILHPLHAQSLSIAEVVHSTKKSFKTLKPDQSNERGSISFEYQRLEPIILIAIGKNGELFVDPFCTISLLDIFKKQGRYGAYRNLQAEIISSYHDMTRPLQVSVQYNQTPTDIRMLQNNSVSKEPLDVFRKLVIPRISSTQSQDITQEKINKDITGPSIRYHGVVWHRRRLPSGWSASPHAIELALAMGITLNDGETIVKEHHRGSKKIGEVVGHELLDRS